jgi:hypothetical protein
VLHVHGHEPAKHFLKSLFATFLGLLMALGMESCHQERHRNHVAREALESVLQEVKGNRAALTNLAAKNRDLPENMGRFIHMLESLQDARQQHHSWVPKNESIDLTITFDSGRFRTAAWTMALANQSVQRFPKAQAEDLATFYNDLARFQAFLDQPVDFTPMDAISVSDSEQMTLRRLERLSPAELEHLISGMHTLRSHFNLSNQWVAGINEELKALKSLQ